MQKSRIKARERSIKLIHLIEKNGKITSIVSRHLSSTVVEKQLSKIYDRFHSKKLQNELYYYKSKPTMIYKMLKNLMDSQKREPDERNVREITRNNIVSISEKDITMICDRVISTLSRNDRIKNRRQGR